MTWIDDGELYEFAKRAARTMFKPGRIYAYADRDDITQEIALRLWQAKQRGTTVDGKIRWAIAHRAMQDYFRQRTTWDLSHRRRAKNIAKGTFISLVVNSYDALSNPEDWFTSFEDDFTQIVVTDQLSKLTLRQRTVLFYEILLGYNDSQIANILDITPSRVYQIKTRAYSDLAATEISADPNPHSPWPHHARDILIVAAIARDS